VLVKETTGHSSHEKYISYYTEMRSKYVLDIHKDMVESFDPRDQTPPRRGDWEDVSGVLRAREVLNVMKTYHVRSSSSMKLSCWTLLEDAMMCGVYRMVERRSGGGKERP